MYPTPALFQLKSKVGEQLSETNSWPSRERRIASGSSLRKLLLGWNLLRRLPERVERSHLEVLDVQHNQLAELPHNLFIKAQR